MRILVLGGDGYLGWPTALHLSEHGHEVAVADDSRHFIMYDAPEWMWKKMDEFLAKSEKK